MTSTSPVGSHPPPAAESGLRHRIRHHLQIAREAGFDLRPGARILDLGCGEGATVSALRAAGYDAVGCETVLRGTAEARRRFAEGLVRPIPADPYTLPFDDGEFDLILSDEVLEHVMDYEDLVRESHRVLRPGGMAVHIFPGRWMPLEGHLHVPLASVVRNYPWLLLWARLGVRNGFQKGEHYRDVARFNHRWLREQTNYLTTTAVRRMFERRFATVEFREDLFLAHSASRRGRIADRVVRAAPILLTVYRTLSNRVLVVRRAT